MLLMRLGSHLRRLVVRNWSSSSRSWTSGLILVLLHRMVKSGVINIRLFWVVLL
jgi:hypothetical protein